MTGEPASQPTPDLPDTWRPAPGARTLHGEVRGRTWLWSAAARGGPTVLSCAATALVARLDGTRTWAEAARDAGVAQDRATSILDTLVSRGLVPPWSGRPPFPRPEPERRLSVWWHVTNACNLACPHCYIDTSSGEMSDEVAARTLARLLATCAARDLKTVEIKVAGGEPLLRRTWLQQVAPRWRDVLKKAGVETRFVFLTNGTCIDRGVVRLLRSLPAVVSVSLDGIGEVQDRVRPGPKGLPSFARVREGLQRLVDGGIQPYVLVTLSGDNAAGLGALGDFLMESGLGFRVSIERDLRTGARRFADDPLARALMDLYARVEARLPLGYRFIERHKLCDLSLLRPIRRACGAGETHLAVGHDGRAAACQALLTTAGREPGDGEDLITAARDARLGRGEPCATCRECPFHQACAGGCPLLLVRREEPGGGANGTGPPDAPGAGAGAGGVSPYCEIFQAMIPRILELAALDFVLREAVPGAR
ncbi:MAG: radical SAM protein [Deltaproteobacteria bacterium]|nr:radical SAM protein [Deltaproteobacteria bacterium]